jgi:hypothetical protein
MIVPEYWAEARIQKRFPDRQITVRRFGWSDESQEAAQAHADQRVADAFQQIVDGAKLPRRELRRGYNGAEGVPIREEIVARHGDTVITRNSYGALCLNTPNVLFADVDIDESQLSGTGCLLLGLAASFGSVFVIKHHGVLWGLIAAAAGLLVGFGIVIGLESIRRRISGSPRAMARKRIETVMEQYSNWSARLYSTPAGFRLLVTSQTFEPGSDDVAAFFKALNVDRVYATMCLRQNCFRARVSPKPWRIEMERHIVPRRGGWPVAEELLPERQRWIAEYDQLAIGFSSCRFEAEFGSMPEDDSVRAVRILHDEYCRALTDLPTA